MSETQFCQSCRRPQAYREEFTRDNGKPGITVTCSVCGNQIDTRLRALEWTKDKDSMVLVVMPDRSMVLWIMSLSQNVVRRNPDGYYERFLGFLENDDALSFFPDRPKIPSRIFVRVQRICDGIHKYGTEYYLKQDEERARDRRVLEKKRAEAEKSLADGQGDG